MYKIFLFTIAVIVALQAHGQDRLKTLVKDKHSGKALSRVTINIPGVGAASTNDEGLAEIDGIPQGKQVVRWSHSGFLTVIDTISFPLSAPRIFIVEMEQENEEMEEVIVQSTRTGRTISNSPTRVEIIDGEELDEKNNMRPANVSMLLHESTGIQVQQTSATSGNASLRIQGLDGRYTQLLKDGYPNFGNFASGLSILEIPPLDLKQVEVIKGPASTLYGGGAIAGVVNFISRVPRAHFEGDIILNQSNVGQTNLGGYFSRRGSKFGYSMLGLLNLQKAYDVDEDDFSELPRHNNFTLHPRVFWYPDESITLMLGNSLSSGNNTGGDMHVIKGDMEPGHIYSEKNHTIRNTSTLEAEKRFSQQRTLKFKQAATFFHRKISVPDYQFAGDNINSFSDLSYFFSLKQHHLIGGANFIYDQFKQESAAEYDNRAVTAGLYFQDSWDLTEAIKLEGGLRGDQVSYRNNNFEKKEVFLLPRISALFKLSPVLASRIGGGMGYKIPTIFTERTEAMQYQQLLVPDSVRAEKSTGFTADLNYKTNSGGAVSLSFNQMFFYTNIQKPLILEEVSGAGYRFVNAIRPVISRGFETNLRLVFWEDLKLFAGYTYTDARATYLTNNQVLPLMPRHKINAVIMYEKHDNFKLGLEGYHTGSQFLYDGSRTPAFWEFGFMAQKTFNKISLFINFENFTDQRQSRYKRVMSGTPDRPVFDDIWNHTEGRVINGGIKIKI